MAKFIKKELIIIEVPPDTLLPTRISGTPESTTIELAQSNYNLKKIFTSNTHLLIQNNTISTIKSIYEPHLISIDLPLLDTILAISPQLTNINQNINLVKYNAPLNIQQNPREIRKHILMHVNNTIFISSKNLQEIFNIGDSQLEMIIALFKLIRVDSQYLIRPEWKDLMRLVMMTYNAKMSKSNVLTSYPEYVREWVKENMKGNLEEVCAYVMIFCVHDGNIKSYECVLEDVVMDRNVDYKKVWEYVDGIYFDQKYKKMIREYINTLDKLDNINA